jgi:hypothetical protein
VRIRQICYDLVSAFTFVEGILGIAKPIDVGIGASINAGIAGDMQIRTVEIMAGTVMIDIVTLAYSCTSLDSNKTIASYG